MHKKERLDKLLVDLGLVKSRERARALVMEGKVLVDGLPADKAGTFVSTGASVSLKEDDIPYVSRGGLKLEAALDAFGIDPSGMTAMDIGCSTGGFTDCLLKKNARKVYAIDVGYGQFDWTLRRDSRVELHEKTNIRHIEKDAIPELMDLIVIDVSFISLLLVLPKAVEFLKDEGIIIALVKPQFEVGKGEVGKGGIVRDDRKRLEAVERVKTGSEGLGLFVRGMIESPLRGQKGNIEYLMLLMVSK